MPYNSNNSGNVTAQSTDKSVSNITQLNICVGFDKLDFLRRKHRNEKYSYADAYIYLLFNTASSMSSQRHSSLAEPTALLKTNFTQLANDWHWDRGTARHFIQQMQDIGLLLFDQKGKELYIYITD